MPVNKFNALRVILISFLVVAGVVVTLLPHWLKSGKYNFKPVILKGEGRARSEFFLPESIHIIDRLRKVIDPELGADIISLALLETLAIDSPGVVRVVLGATTPFCPYLQQIAQITLDTILNTPGIVRATVKLDPNLNHPRRW